MSNFEPVSVCRHCRSYHLEGRRGGFCAQLGTPVQGCWKACTYAIPPFAPSWETSVGLDDDLTTLLWQHSQESAASAISVASNGQTQSTIEVVGTCTSDAELEMSESEFNGATVSVKAL